jgi:hypothetical protein
VWARAITIKALGIPFVVSGIMMISSCRFIKFRVLFP